MPHSFRLRRPLTLAAVLLVALLSSRCHTTTTIPPAGASLAGTWRVTSLTATPATPYGSDLYQYFNGRVPCFAEIRYAFAADGTLTARIPNACPLDGEDLQDSVGFDANSKWALDGNGLTVTSSDGLQERYDLQVAGTSMKWVFQNDADPTYTYTVTFVRE